MFQILLSSRAFRVTVVFFVVVASGSWFYSRHVQRTIEAELAKTDAMLHSLKNDDETRDDQDTVDTTLVDSEQTKKSLETADTQMSDATAVSQVENTSEMLDAADASLPEEDVPESPFGFGPYPEVPEGYSQPPSWLWTEETLAKAEEAIGDTLSERGSTFTDHLRTAELMHRVWIKLFNEGRNVYGITSRDGTGLFYPTEENVIYVAWGETTDPDGTVRRYITEGSGIVGLLTMEERMGYEPIPDWLEVKSYEDGIDPYEFLGLNR